MKLPTVTVVTESAYKRYHGRPDSHGWNTSTHFATIDFGDGNPQTAFIKLMVLEDRWPQLGNETIGYSLASAASIPCPERATILLGSAEFFKGVMGSDYPEDAPASGPIGAWCTSLQPHLNDAAWISGDEDLAILGMLRTKAGAQITAFDLWLANADRNRGNLLRLSGGRWAVIDHEMIFMTRTATGDWRKGSILNIPVDAHLWRCACTYRTSRRINGKDFDRLTSSMIEQGDGHRPALLDAQQQLTQLLSSIYSVASAKNVLDFLQSRSEFRWMRTAVSKLI